MSVTMTTQRARIITVDRDAELALINARLDLKGKCPNKAYNLTVHERKYAAYKRGSLFQKVIILRTGEEMRTLEFKAKAKLYAPSRQSKVIYTRHAASWGSVDISIRTGEIVIFKSFADVFGTMQRIQLAEYAVEGLTDLEEMHLTMLPRMIKLRELLVDTSNIDHVILSHVNEALQLSVDV